MKFGHLFQESLKDGFPAGWQASAISYRLLKKCIKRVGRELAELGLSADTLELLLRSVEQTNASASAAAAAERASFQYRLADDLPTPVEPSARKLFHPKLVFAVDEETGEPLDVRLGEETRRQLHLLALEQGLTDVRVTEERRFSAASDDSESGETSMSPSSEHINAPSRCGRPVRAVEVSLTSDSEFFNKLTEELSVLKTLQDEEQQRLTRDIKALGDALRKVVEPDSKASKSDLQQWRRIFELYLESRIFYSTNEQDHGAYSFLQAREHLQKFNNSLIASEGVLTKFRRKESGPLLSQFLHVNAELLQNIHFHELNKTAVIKILKKFDKRTSLNASLTFPSSLPASSLQRSISKAICYELHNSLLPIVPQIMDYQCAICTSIHWRPVRLRCGHVFCIRCMVVMQRNKTTKCPFCREESVMEADEDNLDKDMAKFLKRYFPHDVKAKQKENERAAGVDQFGDAYGADDEPGHRCELM